MLRKFFMAAVSVSLFSDAFAAPPLFVGPQGTARTNSPAAASAETPGLQSASAVEVFADFPINSTDFHQLNARERLMVELNLNADADVLELERFDVLPQDGIRVVDGISGLESSQNPEVALFRGGLRGDARSRAFLSVSPSGTYGFVRRDSDEYIISSGPPGSNGATLIFNPRLVPQELMPFQPFECAADLLPNIPLPAHAGQAQRGIDFTCRTIDLAIETDQEFLGLFGGNTSAAGAYIATLVGAVSEIYQRDTTARFRVVWSRLWTGTDPWDQGNTSDQLQQFRSYWNSNMTGVSRHAVHMLSGRNLGGGIAYLSALCASGFDYGLSANLDGFFPYPIQNNHPLNWDLMVVAHELGHNCGAPHTHSMSPPVDCCGGGYTPNNCGNVQDCAAADANIGTIMSYCHICPGGMTNMRMEFHSRTIFETILPYFAAAEGSCGLSPEAPAISDQPDSLTTAVGASVQFSVTAENGWPLTYQWRKGGVAVTNGGPISGATTATLTISPVAFGHAGVYDVVVTPVCGPATTSNSATLGVCPPQTVLYVDDSATGANSGLSWPNAFVRLQDALSLASVCTNITEIWVAEGTYRPDETNANPNGTGDRNATFQMRNGLSIIGGFRGLSGDEGVNNNTTRPLDGVTGRPTLASQLTGDLFENDNSASAIALSPVGNWLFDTQVTGVTPDESSNNLDATLVNGATLGAGVYGSVLSLTAEGQHARVSNSPLFSFTNDFSVAFWVKADGARPGATLIDKSHGAGNGLTGWAVQSTPGTGELRLAVGTGTGFPETNIANALDNSWHHICYTVSLTPNLRVRAYRDGALVNDVTHGYTTIATNAGDLFFGRHFEIPDRMFVGELDGIALFARAINDSEVAKLATPNLDNSFHVVSAINVQSSAVLDCFSVQRGFANGSGGGTPLDRGAGVFCEPGSPTMRNCTLTGNFSLSGGAAMSNADGANPTIENCAFVSNRSNDDGAAILNRSCSATITNCLFDQCQGNLADLNGGGGAISNHSSFITVQRCAFTQNVAPINGGGAMFGAGGSITSSDCTFDSNSAPNGGGGGAIRCQAGCVLTLLNCSFNANSASTLGGAVYDDGCTSTIRDCLFNGNVAGGDGGALATSNGYITATRCLFMGNHAGGVAPSGGGAIFVTGGPAQLLATNCRFLRNNAANDGGAIRIVAGAFAKLRNSEFSGNTSGEHGGALNLSNLFPLAHSDVINCTFTLNSAGNQFGGAIHHGGGELNVRNSILWGNLSDPARTIYVSEGNPPTFATILYCNLQGVTGPNAPSVGPTVINQNPQFLDADGADNIAGTIDDDSRPAPGSPVVDAGSNLEVPDDNADLDGDGIQSEPMPVDLAFGGNPSNSRFLDATCVANTGVPGNGYTQVVDMGAYEYVESDCDGDGIGDACDSNDFIEITAQPQSQTVCAGEPVALGVNAAGAPPITYQWRRNSIALTEGGAFGGTQQNVLLVNPASSAVAGSYDVVITGTCGSVTSNAAILTVTVIPGDINQSGEVDIADLTGLLSNFGALSGATFAMGDLDGDRDVDLNDLTAMLSAFGTTCN